MQLTGKQLLQATPPAIWELLMDTEVLTRVVPGISSLEQLSDNSFKSILQIKIGPVSGSFSGNFRLADIEIEKSFTIKTQQLSKIGNANAEVRIQLAPTDGTQTELAFDGDVKISGLLATMGQRVLSGVANTLTRQFFTNLERELRVKESPP
jgi:carbon monoxide dehydrogenase subunit G